MGEWKEYKIEDIVTLEYGKSLKDYRNNIGEIEVFGTNGKIGQTSKSIFDKPSIIIGRKGAYREVHFAKRPFFVIDTAFYTKTKNENINVLFLYYWFKNIDINSMDSGSAIPSTSRDEVYDLDISLPPLPEQKSIAAILSSLDDKIDLLHRQNATLEAMAETLFRQWFVEEAKEEWEDCTLVNLCSFIGSGGTPSTKIESYYMGDINWYSTKELKDNFLYESVSKITKEGLKNSSAKLFPAGSVVIAIYAAPTVGRLGILTNEACFNQAACGFIVNEDFCCSEFIYLFLKNQRNELNAMASGSAQQNLNVGKIKSYPAFKVPKEIMEQFKKIVQPVFKKINNNTLQIHTLITLRDTLLPKLMSGELRVEN